MAERILEMNGVKVKVCGCLGDGLRDVGFTHQFEGTFNVSAILRDKAKFEVIEFPLTQNVINAVRMIDTSLEQIAKIPLGAAISEPGIVIQCKDGTVFQADGAHRIMKLILNHVPVALAYFVPYDQREAYRQWFEVFENGQWRVISSTEDLGATWGNFEHHDPAQVDALMKELGIE